MVPTDSYFKPDKEREFKLYVIWKSLAREMTPKLMEELGVSDTVLLELAELKTQKQFAEKYGVDVTCLTDWNKHIESGDIDPELKTLDWRYWAKQMTPSVGAAVLRNLRKHGDAARASWWMKHVEGVEDKQTVKVEWEGLAGLVKEADEVLREHGENT